VITAATNRNQLQPTTASKKRRRSHIKKVKESVDKGKQRSDSSTDNEGSSKSKLPLLGKLLRQSSSSSAKSDKSQLVDLVVEDHDAEELERVRARKEGGSGWNEEPPKHFVQAYEEGAQEEVREGFAPDSAEVHNPEQDHNLTYPFTVGEQSPEELRRQGIKPPVDEEAERWETRDFDEETQNDKDGKADPQYASFREERNVWNNHS
jgi:hypothetical protein